MLSGTLTSASARASSTRPSVWRRRTPSSSRDFVTSSTKNGFPSALAAISSSSSEGSAALSSSDRVMACIAGADSACGAMRTW
jgi:formate-dependent phosphoribosylglycinamide formyltransferase (GAR transformylase)